MWSWWSWQNYIKKYNCYAGVSLTGRAAWALGDSSMNNEKKMAYIFDTKQMAVDFSIGALIGIIVPGAVARKLVRDAERNMLKNTCESSSYNTARSYGIDIDNLNFSNTVQNHIGRPYQDSKLLINEIIESKPPVPDPRGTNALSWTVTGTFNGSKGYYELIIDPASNTVWHFVFKSQ